MFLTPQKAWLQFVKDKIDFDDKKPDSTRHQWFWDTAASVLDKDINFIFHLCIHGQLHQSYPVLTAFRLLIPNLNAIYAESVFHFPIVRGIQ